MKNSDMSRTICKIEKIVNDGKILIRLIDDIYKKYNEINVLFGEESVNLKIDKKAIYVYDYDNHPYYYIERDTKDNLRKRMTVIRICEKNKTIYTVKSKYSVDQIRENRSKIEYDWKIYEDGRLYTSRINNNDYLNQFFYIL